MPKNGALMPKMLSASEGSSTLINTRIAANTLFASNAATMMNSEKMK